MPDLDFSGPWGKESDGSDATPFLQSQIRQAWGGWSGDGFVDDGAAGYLAAVTATGTDTTVSVHFFNGVIRGMHVEQDSTPLDVEASGGTSPTSGQTRIDSVIIRLDFAAKTAELLVKCGTPHAVLYAAPALTQQDDVDGVWEHEIAQIRRTGNVAVTQAMITQTGQRFIAPTVYATPNATVQGVKALLGTVTFTNTDITVCRRTVAGDHASLGHKSILDPDWTVATLSSSTWEISATSRAPSWRVFGGLLQLTAAVRKKTGYISTSVWSTVATIPVSSLPAPMRGRSPWMDASAHDPSGNLVAWRFVVPDTGSASLQVLSPTSASLTTVTLALFQIPVGA